MEGLRSQRSLREDYITNRPLHSSLFTLHSDWRSA